MSDLTIALDALEREGAITPTTRRVAEEFVLVLHQPAPCPQMSYDEDGGLTMIWELGEHRTIVVVDGPLLAAVLHAGEPTAKYFDDVEWTGRIPEEWKPCLP